MDEQALLIVEHSSKFVSIVAVRETQHLTHTDWELCPSLSSIDEKRI